MTGENHAWIAERFPSLDLGSLNCLPGIQYNAFSATREQIQKLIDAKFLNVDNLPRDKVGSQSWEKGARARVCGRGRTDSLSYHGVEHSARRVRKDLPLPELRVCGLKLTQPKEKARRPNRFR